MARTLEELQKQYNSAADPKKSGATGMPRGRGPGGHGPGRNPGASGKPKDMKRTLSRLMHYVGDYKGRLAAVLLCMLVSTVTSLLGSYMLAPIIDKLALAAKPDAVIQMSATEQMADRMVSGLIGALHITALGEVMAYIVTAVILLGLIYLVGIATTYWQGRLMLSVSQGVIERIRNDLFEKLQGLPVRYFDSHPTVSYTHLTLPTTCQV